MKQLIGTGVALVTPFDRSGNVDLAGLKNLVEHCISGGVEYLVALGTTGESATLNKEEKKAVRETIVETAAGRVPVVLGMGGNNTGALADEIAHADLSPYAAILSVSPYYNKPTQEGIYQHYKRLSESTEKPIILYNVPGRTASNVSAETTLRLAHDFSNIVATKEASGNMDQIMAIIKDRPANFLVISGDDNLTLPMIALGGNGVISVSGQGFPKIFTQMVRQALAGNLTDARSAHYQLYHVTNLLFAEGNPGGIKVVLEAQNICGAHMRQPLWPVSDGLKQKLVAEVKSLIH